MEPRIFVYKQIRNEIIAAIEAGKYRPGDRIESEVTLAERYQCSFHTVRKALALLVRERRIERHVGLGSFVLDKRAKQTVAAGGGFSRGVAMLIQPDPGMFTMTAVEHINEEAERKGFYLNIRPVRSFDTTAIHAVEQMQRMGCFAVLIPRFDTDAERDLAGFIAKSPLPVVIPELLPGLEKNCYYRDEYSGEIDYAMTAQAFNYFKSIGYSNIAFFGPDRKYDMPLQRRLASYSSMVSRFGFPAFIGLAGNDFSEVDQAVSNWAEHAGKMAVICYDDNSALRLMTALHKRSFRIPADFAVLGSNNSPECLVSDPPLSSIEFPFREMAKGMIAHALAMSSGSGSKIDTIGTGKLIVRASCGGRPVISKHKLKT